MKIKMPEATAGDRNLKIFRLSLVIACILNFTITTLLFFNVSNLKESIASNTPVASVFASEEDEEFIEKVCKDLQLENKVTILVGPYYIHSFFSPSQNYKLKQLLSTYPVIVDPLDPTKRILMGGSIYNKLTADERRVVIAHEIWHIYSFIKNDHTLQVGVNAEIEADNFAIRYISPDVLKGLLHRYGGENKEVKLRLEELERKSLVPQNNQVIQ